MNTSGTTSDLRRIVVSSEVENHDFYGLNVRAYRRTYASAENTVTFSGGLIDEHRWLDREDLLKALEIVGFSDIRTAHDEPGHAYGPALSIFARK